MSRFSTAAALVLFLFALSFTYFAVQSGDVLMYLSIARDFLLKGTLPVRDPYLYSLQNAELHVSHEYLSHLMFYGAWWLLGIPGLTILKMALLAILFACVLLAGPRAQNSSPLWMLLWCLAVIAGSFRFIERTSLISDLFSVALALLLVRENRITPALIVRLSLVFLFWVQMHPGFPVGLVLVGVWYAWHALRTPDFNVRQGLWLLVPAAVLVLNPTGIYGAIYPFEFALNQAVVFKRHTLEWFPSYHPAFRFAPETIAFWLLLIVAAALVTRARAWLSLRGVFVVIAAFSGISAVRFIPWASFAIIGLIKPFSGLARPLRPVTAVIMLLMFAVGIRNITKGYKGSSGPRLPRLELDSNFFPEKSVEFLRAHPIPGRLYNAHDFGSYLIWTGYTPIFHHGFVTDTDFYESDVIGVFRSQQRFLELAKKYGWTKLLVDKHGSYPYFYKILSPLPEWRIVAEDDASYLIYLLPDQKDKP